MKGIRTSIVCCALAGATLTSCIGSYALFHKVRGWNEQATGNKFLNELIHIGLWIVPVYEVTFLADILVLTRKKVKALPWNSVSTRRSRAGMWYATARAMKS